MAAEGNNALTALKTFAAQQAKAQEQSPDWGVFNLGNTLTVSGTSLPVTSYSSANLGI